MIPVALVAEAIRRAEARADIGSRVVAGARAGGADGVLAAVRSGLREPDVDLLPPSGDVGEWGASAPGRRRIALATHDGAPLGVVDLPDGQLDPLVLDAAMAAARVGLEHADAVARLHVQIAQLEASRSQFVGTVEQERRRLNAQLSSGLRAPLQGLATVLAEASAALAGGDEGAARSLLVAARARLAVAHDDLRLLARGVYPAVLSQSGLAVALRALAEDAAGRLRIVVSPSVEARRRSPVVEAAAYFVVEAAAPADQGVLDVTVTADPGPDGDGIDLVLSGAVPELTMFITTDEARRVAALGGVIAAHQGSGISVRVPDLETADAGPAGAEVLS